MELEHSFTVPVDADDAYTALLDVESVVSCMPGAALDTIDGDDFTGTVKVKLGPIGITYKGKASIVEKDPAARRVVLRAQGRDARGNGTAAATVTATLTEEGSATKVDVRTDLDITGKPAQFGRGVLVDVGNKLIGQFADCLAGKLGAGGAAAGEAPAGTAAPAAATPEAAAAPPATEPAAEQPPEPRTPAPAPAPRAAPAPQSVEPIDLLQSAGPALAKRMLPLLAALVVLVVIVLRLRRR